MSSLYSKPVLQFYSTILRLVLCLTRLTTLQGLASGARLNLIWHDQK